MPRGSGGNFRGRGSRGRGTGGRNGRGRGRGRGRAFDRYGPNSRFDSTRLAEEESGTSEDDLSHEGNEDAAETPSDAGDDEADETQKVRPYMALLEGFNNESDSRVKRRKLGDDNANTNLEAKQDPTLASAVGSEGKRTADPDEVEEEEDPTIGLEEKMDDDSDDEDNSTDPFDTHFAHPDEAKVSKRVQAVKSGRWATHRKLLQPLRATIQLPEGEDELALRSVSGPESLGLKKKLQEMATLRITQFDTTQSTLGSLLFNYDDILYCDRTVNNSDRVRKIVCLHALNHIYRTRDRVIKNNYKLSHAGEDNDLELRDQGFTRPKVLFILPTRNSCVRMVNIIRDLCDPDQQENRKRFDDSYIDKESKFGADRPTDFTDLFEGNDDDMFRLGVKFTRKTIKYFSQFYNSDVLMASPLGLRMAMGSDDDKKKVDTDFLSSIEMVIVDQADALLMQNWEHVEYIFEHLNLQPKDAHGCDFSRIRNWYLDDCAKYFRQSIVLSAFNTPELSELQRAHCHNWAGKVRLLPEYPGLLQQLGVKTKQTFSRFQSSTVEKDPDARFDYFTSAVVPSLVKRAKDSNGTLVFIPSYLDFVRVRNYFATSPALSSITFGAISEYADVPEASRARSHFLNGRHKILLYTERAHHFRRYHLTGVKRVIFYGLPDNPIFYKEIAGGYLAKSEQDMTLEPGQGSVRAMFSKYDVMKLDRIVGSKRVGKMLQDRGDTFEFI